MLGLRRIKTQRRACWTYSAIHPDPSGPGCRANTQVGRLWEGDCECITCGASRGSAAYAVVFWLAHRGSGAGVVAIHLANGDLIGIKRGVRMVTI